MPKASMRTSRVTDAPFPHDWLKNAVIFGQIETVCEVHCSEITTRHGCSDHRACIFKHDVVTLFLQL